MGVHVYYDWLLYGVSEELNGNINLNTLLSSQTFQVQRNMISKHVYLDLARSLLSVQTTKGNLRENGV